MNPMTIKTSVSDEELSAAVAEHVAKQHACDKWVPGPHPLMGMMKACECASCYPVQTGASALRYEPLRRPGFARKA